MDSCCATLKANVHPVRISKGSFKNRTSGFFGESIKGSLKGRDLNIQLRRILKSENKVRKFKPGVARSVLTSDVDKETVSKSKNDY